MDNIITETITTEAESTEPPAAPEAGAGMKQPEPVYFQSGLGITQDLSREISAIYEAEHKEHNEPLKEKEVKIVDGRRPLKRDATKVIERMTKAVKSDENKNLPSAGQEETEEKATGQEITEENTQFVDDLPETVDEAVKLAEEESTLQEEEHKNSISSDGIPGIEDNSILVSREEIELAEMEAKRAHEEALLKAEEARAIVEEARKKAEEAERMLAEIEKKHAANNVLQNDENGDHEEDGAEEKVTSGEEPEEIEEQNEEEPEYLPEPLEEQEIQIQEEDSSAAEENLSDDDLPTTRALHTSFDDILTLIGGEPDPSHFVFVGNTFDLITGLSLSLIHI